MKSIVSLIKGNNRYDNIKRSLAILESEIKTKIQGKKKILVKPNCVAIRADRAEAVTHIDALRAVLDFIFAIKDKEARVIVGEDSGVGDTAEAFKNFGYLDLPRQYDLELRALDNDEGAAIKVYSKSLKRDLTQHIFRAFLDSDFRIAVGPPKTHDAVILTLSLKNMVIGALKEKYKTGSRNFHQGPKALHLTIAYLAKIIPPNLAVIDGFHAMEGNGPSAGNIVPLHLVLASCDFLAADSIMARIMGFNPKDIGYLYYCDKLKLGNMDLAQIKIKGNTSLKDNIHKFKPHLTYFLQKRWKINNRIRNNEL
ncbi:MAG: DUF362 domain-containing protein [Candidatus Doudnabacteria bacterium]